MAMADKMYKQNSKGLGMSPKNYQNGRDTKPRLSMKFDMNGRNSGYAKGQHYDGANKKGKFEAKYEQADKSGSMKGGYKQANC